jgi:hypothetical protein
MSNSSTGTAKFNRAEVTAICEDMRAKVESSAWNHKGGKTDWALVLTGLDIVQYTGRLGFFFDARSASFAAGVAPTTASHSLRRICDAHWFIPSPYNQLPMKQRVPKNRANEYMINPAFPNVYRYALPRQAFTPGERWLISAGELESAEVSTGEVFKNLIAILSESTHTYTHDDTRRALLIGRTELGVMLGKSAVAVALKAGDQPRTIKELAGLAQVNPYTAGQVIRRKLAPKGLLANVGGEWFGLADHPGRGWWEGGRWVTGIPLHEYKVHWSSNRVGRRLEIIAGQRGAWKAEHMRREDMWIARELADMAEKVTA